LNSSPSIIRMIKSRRMRWARYVPWMGRKLSCIGYCWESQRERYHCEDWDVGGWIILDLGETGWGGVDWIGVAQDRYNWRSLPNAVMNRLTIFFWVQPRTYFWNYLKVLTVYWNIKLYLFSCIFH
jgi:hypothetical protein